MPKLRHNNKHNNNKQLTKETKMNKRNKITNTGLLKEITDTNKQITIIKNDLVLSIDTMFYDTENLEDQSKIFRTILSQFSNSNLEAIKGYVKKSTK